MLNQQRQQQNGINDVGSRTADYTPPASDTTTAGAAVSGTSANASRRAPQVVQQMFRMIFGVLNTPMPFQSFQVPPGCSVRLRANSGSAVGNAAVCYFATSRDQLAAGHGIPLAPLDETIVPIENTARIWAMGAINDGLVLSITSNPAQA